MPNPVSVCAAIRNSFPGAEYVYTHGGCYEFFRILRSIFPQADAYYSDTDGHVYTQIDDRFFDITGHVKNPPEDLTRIKECPKLSRTAPQWGRQAKFRVVRLLDEPRG